MNEFIKQCFYANMDWFDPAEQPDDISLLPQEFAAAKNMWETDAKANLDKIFDLLTPYIGARLIPSNITNWENLFAASEFEEIEAKKINIAGIDFSRGPIPICKAEALFELAVTSDFMSVDHEVWQEDNSPFTDMVVFYWNVPENDEMRDLDLTFGDNQGVECIPVECNFIIRRNRE